MTKGLFWMRWKGTLVLVFVFGGEGGGRFCRERAEREGRDLRLCAESKVLEAGDLDKNDTWEIEQKRHSTALGL